MVIQAENGILNLTKYLFQSNAHMELEKTTQIQVQTRASSTDTFAKALEQKVEQRVAEKHQQPVVENDKTRPVQEENRYLKRTNERMSNEKLNKKTDSKPVEEKLKELKKALKNEGKKLSPEMEDMLAELLMMEDLPMEQLEALTAMVQEFAGMEELTLSQPLMEVMEQLPEEVVDQITELSEMISTQLEALKQNGGTVELTEIDSSELQEKLETLLATIDETINVMEGEETIGTDSKIEDVLQVLKHLEEVFGEVVNEDGEMDVKTAETINQLPKVFEMVESVETKEVQTPVVEHQEMMRQEVSAQELKAQEQPVKQETTVTTTNEQEVDGVKIEQGTETKQETEADAKGSQDSGQKWQGIEKAVANVQTHTPPQAQAEAALTMEQTANQAVEMNQTMEVSKIQTVQMERAHQNILNQVVNAANMSFNLEDETSEMLIKLKPHSLGNVELKVSIEKGVLLAEFNVESEVVKEALESNLTDLRNALSDKGFNIHELNVSIGQQQQDQGQSSQQRQFARRQKNIGLKAVESVFNNTSLEALGSQSTIDYLG